MRLIGGMGCAMTELDRMSASTLAQWIIFPIPGDMVDAAWRAHVAGVYRGLFEPQLPEFPTMPSPYRFEIGFLKFGKIS